MNLSEERKIINLNSDQATIFNNGDFLSDVQFQTTGLLQDDPNIVYCTIALRNAQIPVSFYVINKNNNILNYSISSIDYSITIHEGNYDAYTFINEMKTQFLVNSHIFSITLNLINGFLTFTNATNEFIFLDTSTLKEIIGFEYLTESISNSLTPNYPMNLLGTLKIKIVSKHLVTDNYDGVLANVMEIIPVDVPPFNLISFNNYNHSNILKLKKIDNIDIQLFDSFNRYIDFNNAPWSITLSLSIFRNYNHFIEKIKEKEN